MARVPGSQDLKSAATSRALPSEDEVRAVRDAIERGLLGAEEVADAALPLAVRKGVDAARQRGPERLRVSAFALSGRAYFLVEADERAGGGWAQVFSPLGERVTRSSLSASGQRSWDPSPAEALREKAIEAFVAGTFKASKLGTSALRPFEVEVRALPPGLQKLAADNKANNGLTFYRLPVYGETFYAEFCRYSPSNPNSAREIGSFTILNSSGDFIGCEFLKPGGPETLKVKVSVERRGRLDEGAPRRPETDGRKSGSASE